VRAPAIKSCAAAVALLALAAIQGGCGSKSPDYHSIWTDSSTTTTTTPPAERLVPIWKYLESDGVTGEQVAPSKLTGLTVSIPTPPGWAKSSNSNYSPGTMAISKGEDYPMAMLMVFKLNGEFHTAEAIKHGYAEAELSENFKRLDASTEDFQGFPSAMIQGTYNLAQTRLRAYNRIVIATGSEDQRYLVQLTVTTRADQAVAHADDVEAIISRFKVAAR